MASFGNLSGLVMAIVTVAVVLAVGGLILGQVYEVASNINNTATTDVQTGITQSLDAINLIPQFLPVIVIAVVGMIALSWFFSKRDEGY